MANRRLAESRYLAGEDYTIADIATYTWFGNIYRGEAYGEASTFLSMHEYEHVGRWVGELDARPGVLRGSGGLSPLGEDLVREANRLGIIIDQSHASNTVFDQMLALSKAPIILSHSGASDVFAHSRNIDDARIRALAKKGGVIQVNSLGGYLIDTGATPEYRAERRKLYDAFDDRTAPTDAERAQLKAQLAALDAKYNIRKADYAVAKLWEAIQSTPGMANDTILIVAPEHGRNLLPNTIIDQYGRYALDHTNDEMTREIFCLIAGPPSAVKQNQVFSEARGESVDIVPTIAHLLGFKTEVPTGMMQGRVLTEALV